MRLNVIIDERTIVNNLSRDELIKFIKEIDLIMADYDFTNELKNYFVTEIKNEDKIDIRSKMICDKKGCRTNTHMVNNNYCVDCKKQIVLKQLELEGECINHNFANVMSEAIKDKLNEKSWICEHANESPLVCPCDDNCICKQEGEMCYSKIKKHYIPRTIVDVSCDFKNAIGYRNGKPISILLEWEKETYCNNGDECNLMKDKYRVVNGFWYKILSK